MLLALFSGACFGTLPILARFAFEAGLSRESMLFWRFLLAFAAIAPFIAGRLARVPRKTLYHCLALGAIGYAAEAACYFTAVERVGAGMAAVLLYLYPGFVTLLTWLFFGEKPGVLRWIAIITALLGCALTSMSGKVALDPVGIACGIGSALAYGAYLVASSVLLKKVDSWTATALVSLGAALTFGLLAQGLGSFQSITTSHQGSIIAGFVLIGTVAPIAALFRAFTQIGVARASIFSTSEPVVSLLLGVWVLGEAFTAQQWVGAGLIVGAVVLTQLSRPGSH